MPARKRKNKRQGGLPQAHEAQLAIDEASLANGRQTTAHPSPVKIPVASKPEPKKKRRLLRIAAYLMVLVGVYIAINKVDESPIPEMITSSPLWDHLNATLQDFTAQLPAFNLSAVMTAPEREPVGEAMAALGHRAHHPVVLVPGFVTSGLELWEGRACGKKYFRQRMWGTMAMAQHFLLNKQCWLDHMSLDPHTGLDPPGIRIRSAVGLEAVDYFIQGYWVWSKLIEALAHVGYDNNNLISMSYDWRLGLPLLEVRDGFFTRMQATIEGLDRVTGGVRVVVVVHSFGESVFRNFLAWVEGRAPGWSERHVAALVNVAGPTLGVPKALSALLSGETRDTADLGGLSAYLTDNVIPMQVRAELFRTWGSVAGLLPVGGCPVWGNATWAPDDDLNVTAAGRTFGAMVAALEVSSKAVLNTATAARHDGSAAASSDTPSATPLSETVDTPVVPPPAAAPKAPGRTSDSIGSAINDSAAALRDTILSWLQGPEEDDYHSLPKRYFNVEEALEMVAQQVGPHYAAKVRAWSAALAFKNTSSPSDTSAFQPRVVDPLTHPLPAAPSMRMYCLYGVGIPTERGYHYVTTESLNSTSQNVTGQPGDRSAADGLKYSRAANSSTGANGQIPAAAQASWRINGEAEQASSALEHGVQLTDGDGTVPLISLGLMCRKGWRSPALNPAGIPITTREYMHTPVASLMDLRGGGGASDHVSMLGNDEMLADIIRIAGGRGGEVGDLLVSDIDSIAARVPLWPEVQVEAPASTCAQSAR